MIDVEVEDKAWSRALGNAGDVAVLAARIAVQTPFKGEGGRVADEIDILLTSDDVVGELNTQFRGRSGPTNVLSFPSPRVSSPHLGDIALAYGVCAREAAEQDKPLADHLMHLVVHGVLHLLGYDHDDNAEAEHMEDIERSILRSIGVADPYARERADVGS